MMYLIEAAEDLGLREIVNQVRESENVHGIMIDIHPLWLEAWKLHITYVWRSAQGKFPLFSLLTFRSLNF
jgi:hypothetical protein